MKLTTALLGLLAAMCAVVGAALVTEEPPAAHGVEHSDFSTMDEGGPEAATRHNRRVLVLGSAFGLLQIAVYAGCLALVAHRQQDRGKFGWVLGVGGFLHAAVFIAMVWAYVQTMGAPDPQFFGPFPVSTAWMLFALWPAPLVFVVGYVVGFDRWILTPADRERFEQLLATRRETRETTE